MATITLKSVPDDLYARLKASAARHRRSINSEAIVCLERALETRRVEPNEFLARLDALRERMGGGELAEGLLKEARASDTR